MRTISEELQRLHRPVTIVIDDSVEVSQKNPSFLVLCEACVSMSFHSKYMPCPH